jgi:hypothetical protein
MATDLHYNKTFHRAQTFLKPSQLHKNFPNFLRNQKVDSLVHYSPAHVPIGNKQDESYQSTHTLS